MSHTLYDQSVQIDQQAPKPLQVYHRRQRQTVLLSADSAPTPTFTDSSHSDLSIALCKGTRSTTVRPFSNFVTYDRLHLSFCNFALSLSAESILNHYQEALLLPQWKTTMEEEMQALTSRGI